MFLFAKTNILTFVMLLGLVLVSGTRLVLANPHLDAPTTPKKVDELDAQVDPQKTENISITEGQHKSIPDEMVSTFNKENYYYPYRKEIEAHGGFVFGVRDSSDDKDLMNYLVGFSYVLPEMLSPKWVLGADISTVGHGHLIVSKRFIYNEKGSFRPFYQYGVMHKFVPDERFVSLSNWDNYLARAGVGLEDIVRPPRSVQIELNVAVGAKDLLVMFTYGYAWGY